MDNFIVNDYSPNDCWLPQKSLNTSEPKYLTSEISNRKLQISITQSEDHLTRSQLTYIKWFDTYLNQNRPFSMSNQQIPFVDKTARYYQLKPIMEQYQNLVRYYLPAENYYLLRKWGISYPKKYFCTKNNSPTTKGKIVFLGGFIDELSSVLGQFTKSEFFIKQGIPLEAIPYYNYLVSQLSQISVSTGRKEVSLQ